jgi:peptide-methionine (S)-S-oxide reductase
MTATRAYIAGTIVVIALFVASIATTTTQAKASALPDATTDDVLSPTPGSISIVLAGGCFWGMEEVFSHVRGVTSVVVGYAGGTAKQADYETVSTGRTRHAESARITYDPSKISYGTVLKVFFSVAHDPTQKDEQWPDVGPQYRSVIFYVSEHQQQLSVAYMNQLKEAHAFKKPIATEVVPLVEFFPAEPYHQHYAEQHPFEPYILHIDKPKLDDLKKLLPDLYVK